MFEKSVPDLEAKAEQAKAAHTAAQESTARMREAFYESSEPSAEKALLKATEAEQSAKLHLEKATHLVGRAKAERDAAQRRDNEHRAAELAAQIADGNPEDARLVQIEAKQFLAAADARAKRRANNVAREKVRFELHRLRVELGQATHDQYQHHFDVDPSHVPVSEILSAAAKTLAVDDPRRDYLRVLGAINFRGW